MNIQLSRETQTYIAEQVSSGAFADASAVMEAAIQELRASQELDRFLETEGEQMLDKLDPESAEALREGNRHLEELLDQLEADN